MFDIEFDPYFAYGLCKLAYCNTTEFYKNDSTIRCLFDINDSIICTASLDINYVIFLWYNNDKNKWVVNHSINSSKHLNKIKKWVNKLKNIDKQFIYIFQYCENNDIKNLCVYDTFSRIFSCENYNYIRELTSNFLCVTHNSIIYFNSKHFMDLFLSTLQISNNRNDVEKVINVLSSDKYNNYFNPIINDYRNLIKSTSNIIPNEIYSQIFTELRLSDTDYYKINFTKFSENMLDILIKSQNHNINKILIDLISGFRKDFVCELTQLYHRFRCFPHERLRMYKKHPNHGYTYLLKQIHNYYCAYGQKINDSIVSDILSEQLDPFHLSNSACYYDNNDFLIYMIRAISNRSEYMTSYHEIYCVTQWSDKKPKYECKPYFPFNIYSCNIFIIEHMFNNLANKL
ncbi:hypothetical protein mvi_382 [Megavirus vitis]|nr:hypothetical protein mvi_382 [Megavirus vitis]